MSIPKNKGGRPRGSGGKSQVKRDMLSVYRSMGGRKALLDWAKSDNETFYRELLRLMPKELEQEVQKNSITLVMDFGDSDEPADKD
jgi:hypothetical protein